MDNTYKPGWIFWLVFAIYCFCLLEYAEWVGKQPANLPAYQISDEYER